MAEAFFNQAARGKAKAISAGTRPASTIDPKVVDAMREVGLDISGSKPKALTQETLEQADLVVTMGCGTEGVCPAAFSETEDWHLDDPKGKSLAEIREIRDEIRTKVQMLLEKLGL